MLNTREVNEIIDRGYVDIELAEIADLLLVGTNGFTFTINMHGKDYKMLISDIMTKEGKQFARVSFLQKWVSVKKYFDLEVVRERVNVFRNRYENSHNLRGNDLLIANKIMNAYRYYDIELYPMEALNLWGMISKSSEISDIDCTKCSDETWIRLTRKYVITAIINTRDTFRNM